jgi:DNA invertase Pin-like site-specific DNA recombinase
MAFFAGALSFSAVMNVGGKRRLPAQKSMLSCSGGWRFWPRDTLRERNVCTSSAAAGPRYAPESFPSVSYFGILVSWVGLVAALHKLIWQGGNSMRVAVYARVSDDQQREKQTIESQLAEVCQFAKDNNWPVAEQHLYIDDGHSGFHFERPALDRLRDAARDGLIDLLLVHDPDRLSRRYAYQVLLLEELQRWGVEVRFLKQPPPDSPEQRLLVQIQGVIAEYERARIMERTRRGRLFWARQGRPVSAKVPFGYRYRPRQRTQAPVIEVDPAESEVVRGIFRRYVEDRWTHRQIAVQLTAEGVPTPTGKTSYWDPSSVGVILQSEAYLGTWFLNRYRSSSDSSGAHQPVTKRPREEWIPISITGSVLLCRTPRCRRVPCPLQWTFPRLQKQCQRLNRQARFEKLRHVANPCRLLAKGLLYDRNYPRTQ